MPAEYCLLVKSSTEHDLSYNPYIYRLHAGRRLPKKQIDKQTGEKLAKACFIRRNYKKITEKSIIKGKNI